MRAWIWILLAVSLALPSGAQAFRSNSIIFIRPSMDGSRYFITEQSQGLYQWGYHLGFNASYAFEPAEVNLTGTGRISGVVDDLLVGFFTGALGVTDWLNVGVDFPVVGYETFYNFIHAGSTQCTVTGSCPKETVTKLGDPIFALKARILDPDRHAIGLSLQPFVTIPIGSGFYMDGFGSMTGGAKLILDANIKRKVFLALNAGWQSVKETRWSSDTANAIVDDLLLLSGGASMPLGKDFEMVGEVFGYTAIQKPWAHQIQSPFAWLGGLRYSPGFIKRWSFGLSGGTGLGRGFGAPKFHALAQIRYKKTKVVELEGAGEETPVVVDAPYEEKIIITQTVHFEFNRWNIRPVSYPILDDVVTVLGQNPQIRKLRVEGHTDWIGSDEYNNRLSLKRANSVRDYLIQKGIEADRLIAEGYGESRPIADNNTDLGRAKNRRTEFTVTETQ
ncbi:MAG: OmpA family protein [Deltaproteobacteria bacterium]|nr:OmpA family protein [Deltaproteobacteria bacterium]MBI4223464.1 OmpA family protein [Deltaproteobacteria bacterium]